MGEGRVVVFRATLGMRAFSLGGKGLQTGYCRAH